LESIEIGFTVFAVIMGLLAIVLFAFGVLAESRTSQNTYAGASCIMGGRLAALFVSTLNNEKLGLLHWNTPFLKSLICDCVVSVCFVFCCSTSFQTPSVNPSLIRCPRRPVMCEIRKCLFYFMKFLSRD